MLVNQRYERIINLLKANGIIDVRTLSKLLDVTEKTVRLDLDALQQQGLLIRVRGGAIYSGSDRSPYTVAQRRRNNPDKKELIAQYAHSLIEENDTIYLDDGSTCMALARLLGDKKVVVITNDLKIANELASKDLITLFLTGGMIKKDESSYLMAGDDTLHMLRKHKIDKAFMSTCTVSLTDGLMIYYYGETSVKRAAMQSAGKVYCLADSSKFEKNAFQHFADVNDFDMIITDNQLDQDIVSSYLKAGINLKTV